MPRRGVIWLTTDTHFYHDKIISACNRPENYAELILRWWKYYVMPQDTLIHLGDVIFYKHGELKPLLDTVKCKKVLTLGNHDRKSETWYANNGFDIVTQSIQFGDVMLSHKPLHPLPDTVRLNIHGHWHNMNVTRPEYYDSRYRLLALEHVGYKPVKLDNWR